MLDGQSAGDNVMLYKDELIFNSEPSSESNHMPPADGREPLALGTEVFLTQCSVDRLNKVADACGMPRFVRGTKVRIIEVPSISPHIVVRGTMLDGPYAGQNLILFREEQVFDP